jgi:FkbM family methyltransferase
MMNGLTGPHLYYSLFGTRGLLLGAEARLLGRSVEVTVAVPNIAHPVRLRLRTTDVALCQEILLRGQYEWEFSRSPRVIVDAGANIGLAAVFYANKFPASRIVAIEPEPSNYEALKKNAAPYPGIVTVHAALWRDNEPCILDPGTGHTTFRTRGTEESTVTESRQVVRGVTLDSLMKELGISYVDLLKVDIEGSEKEVFEHSQSWIGEVGVLAIELHDWIQDGCSSSVRMAASDFDFTCQRGETTYFVRKELASDSSYPEAPPSADRHLNSSKFPLRIIQVI